MSRRHQKGGNGSRGRAGDAVAFSQTHAFCLPSGGHISKRDESVYNFPLSAIDLQTGAEQACLLHVPFEGKVPIPDTNFSKSSAPLGAETIRKHGAYLLAVTRLHVDGSVLEITLGMEDWSAALHFDLSKVESLRIAVANDHEADAVTEWVKSLGDVNKRDDRDSTPLIEISGDVDARYVKALLAAGADVKAKTKTGWTALMYAACYGTAETVQLLIDAGADVSVRDNNCGGQTVLMWAARGAREQKKKVQALIKAGTDPKATLADGWTALMSAANDGGLPVVEVLLEAGLDVNAKTKEGKTALMTGSEQHESATLVPVLLKAGANVQARDNKGRTPLMYAAETGSLENLKTLLRAGADVNDKDNDGKTALDLARKSNFVGAPVRIRVLEAHAKMKP